MPRYAVKEIVSLIVVTYVEADSEAQAEALVEDMEIFDYDKLVESTTLVINVWNEEDGGNAK
jgi:hypothetical protein